MYYWKSTLHAIPRKLAIWSLIVAVAVLFAPADTEHHSWTISLASQLIAPPAFAQAEPPQDIDEIKLRARSFKGSIFYQYKLGDIYSGKIKTGNKNAYEDDIFDERKRNQIEAYIWYSLAAAQLEHKRLLADAAAADPTLDIEYIDNDEIKTAKEAKREMTALRRGLGRITGPSLWTAQHKIVEIYKEGGPAAHYIMGKLYRNGLFVEKSNYDAYVWMLAAEIERFPNAAFVASEYKGRILVNQEFLAVTSAERIVAASATFDRVLRGGGMPGSRGYSWGGDGSSRGGWGNDFQSVRKHRGSGNNTIDIPPGVDSHHSSRSAYDMGNGYLAAGNVELAKTMYEIAIAKEPYSQAAISASRQLQALTMTCSMKDDRVARMSETANRDRVHDIGWDRLQLALKALGYYTPYVDGEPGQETRRAVRAFQREELNVDETGYLTTDQRVELICVAAQDVRDADSQIQLGIMYAQGIGLNCNTAAARAWFQKAADQGHPTALYNLGLMYLEGFYDRQGPGSVPYTEEEQHIAPRRIIDPDIARFYFKEAQEMGHPKAGGMLAKASRPNAHQATMEPGVISCIDYEVEVKLFTIEEKVKDLAVMVNGLPAGQCTDLSQARQREVNIRKMADSTWNYIQKYDELLGQSDRAVNRMPIAKTKGILDMTKKSIDAKISGCP